MYIRISNQFLLNQFPPPPSSSFLFNCWRNWMLQSSRLPTTSNVPQRKGTSEVSAGIPVDFRFSEFLRRLMAIFPRLPAILRLFSPRVYLFAEILAAISANRPRADVAYCIHALWRRLSKTRNWIVWSLPLPFPFSTLLTINRNLTTISFDWICNFFRLR